MTRHQWHVISDKSSVTRHQWHVISVASSESLHQWHVIIDTQTVRVIKHVSSIKLHHCTVNTDSSTSTNYYWCATTCYERWDIAEVTDHDWRTISDITSDVSIIEQGVHCTMYIPDKSCASSSEPKNAFWSNPSAPTVKLSSGCGSKCGWIIEWWMWMWHSLNQYIDQYFITSFWPWMDVGSTFLVSGTVVPWQKN